MCLQAADQAQDRRAGHQAVRIQRNEEVIGIAITVAELGNIACLEAGIVGATAIMNAVRGYVALPPEVDQAFFFPCNIRVRGVAEHMEPEHMTIAGGVDAAFDLFQPVEGGINLFVTDGECDGGAPGNRGIAVSIGPGRIDIDRRVAGQLGNQEPDHRVPEP